MPVQTFSHKIGDTFIWGCELTAAQLGSTDLAITQVRSQVRRYPGMQLISTLLATVGQPVGESIPLLLYREDTGDWPIGKACFDLQLTLSDGRIVSTETVIFNIAPDVTQ